VKHENQSPGFHPDTSIPQSGNTGCVTTME
jgi:hypothetical protein